MYPTLCQIGPLTIHSYGVMVALAVLVCTFLLRRDALRQHWNADVFMDLVFWVAVFGILGSRIFFVFLHFPYFVQHPVQIFFVHQGGLAWQGGLLLATITGIIFIRHHKLPLLPVLDFVIPYAALGQSIGRLGCFLNGCCHGMAWDQGLYFPVHHARLHPVQLYSALNLFVIFVFLKFYQSRNKIDGRVCVWYFILSSVERFFVQFLRADYDPVLIGLGVFQLINVSIFVAALYADLYLLRQSRRRA